jgi:single-stranded DNA-binding protein
MSAVAADFSIIEGVLVFDPIWLDIKGCEKICRFTVGQDEERQEKNGNLIFTNRNISVLATSRLAEYCQQFLKNGEKVLIKGIYKNQRIRNLSGNIETHQYLEARSIELITTKKKIGDLPRTKKQAA